MTALRRLFPLRSLLALAGLVLMALSLATVPAKADLRVCNQSSNQVSVALGYLDELGIAYCGRYGDWGYMWTDESFISGERAAQTALTCSR